MEGDAHGRIIGSFGNSQTSKIVPEGTRLEDLENLIAAVKQDGIDTLVLMLHSSSLVGDCLPMPRMKTCWSNFTNAWTAYSDVR